MSRTAAVAVLMAAAPAAPRLSAQAVPAPPPMPAAPSRAVPSAVTPVALDSARITAVADSVLQAFMARGAASGAQVAIGWNGRVVYERGVGLADRERQLEVTPAMRFRIGSVTKQFTSALVLRRAERGIFDLDAPAAPLLPEAPWRDRPVLLRHLLNHTSGIPNYTEAGPRWQRQEAQPFPADSLYALLRDTEPLFEPGAQWRYSNSGYWLLGRILERQSGRPWGTLVVEELAAPLGLASIAPCPDSPQLPRDALGYARRAGSFVLAEPTDMSHPFAAGALCSTASDLVRWTFALHGGRVIGAQMLARMTTPDSLTNGSPQRYGYGVMTARLGAHPAIAHNGGINGFGSHLGFWKNDGLVVAVLVNTEGPMADGLFLDLSSTLLGVPRPQPRAAPAR